MQKVAAYLLERRVGMDSAEARSSETAVLNTEVTKWAASKGSGPLAASGTYTPEDGSVGSYQVVDAVDRDRAWWMVELQEDNSMGRRFAAAVSVTTGLDLVSVYVTLETGWIKTQIMPVDVDPRCPRIVRNLLALPGAWFHGASELQESRSIEGFEQGELLAGEIVDSARTVPILIVSTENGYCALPKLDEKLALDLVALANVVVVDEGASWALRQTLGPQWGCYRGAVRLFWPHFSRDDDRYQHPLWTAQRLVSAAQDARATRDRFRRQLRSRLFRTSALSVIRPHGIDEIREAARKNALNVLRQRASSDEENKELLDLFDNENNKLRQELEDANHEIERLSGELVRVESDKQALKSHLQAAKATAGYDDTTGDIAPDT